MRNWRARLLVGFMLVAMMLATVAGPAIADNRDDCRRFHGDLYCEVDRGDRFDRFDYDYSYYNFYPFYYNFYPYYYNDCGFDWDGPVTPYDCFD